MRILPEPCHGIGYTDELHQFQRARFRGPRRHVEMQFGHLGNLPPAFGRGDQLGLAAEGEDARNDIQFVAICPR